MIVYTARKSEFLQDVDSDKVHELIHEEFRKKLLRKAAPNQILAWKNSMQHMKSVLDDDEIPADAKVHIEYNLPATGKCIDFILTGKDADNNDKAVIIELKQWSDVEKTGKDGVVRTRLGGGIVETSHPSYQAWSYAAHIHNFNETVRNENIGLEPCAYLHNLSSDKVIRDEFYKPHLDNAPVFISRDAKKLSEFLKRHVKYGDSSEILYRIEHGKIKPSKHLADSLASMLKGNQEFILLDDQKLVYEEAMKIARDIPEGKKRVLIVNGGPGTGKSVLAINLLSQFTSLEYVAQYVSKNAAPREVFKAKLKGHFRKTYIDNMFKGSGAFVDCAPDSIDILIADEAHRLNEKSGLYSNLGENQVREIINAAKFSIFFLDEDQRVTLKDIGRADEIRNHAKALGAEITQSSLSSQFRCNGSDAYLAFADDLLQIRQTANPSLEGLDYTIRVFDNPVELKNQIVRLNHQNKARMVAGYCWDWKSKSNPDTFDIIFPEFGFKAQWNLGSDGSLWAIAEGSVEQVGCIHTCQGLEFDYVGVIIGPDLIVRDGKAITSGFKRSKNDQSIKGFKSQHRANPAEAEARVDAIIKNTYRTLMTRGQKGCFIYCTDAETNAYFKERIESLPAGSPQKYADLRYPVRNAEQVKPFENALPIYDFFEPSGSYNPIQQIDWVELPKHLVHPNNIVARFRGKSSYSKVNSGDWCLFRKTDNPSHGSRYLVRDGENLAISNNPELLDGIMFELVMPLD